MSVEPPHALDPNFRIELPTFEGPLDLLLHLIQKHELDILDLPIAFVTERYLLYLSMMKELNLDVAAEYLVMAATLVHIKSKMLLPQVPEGQDDDGAEEEIDPRADLIRRLLEYQKYKLAGEQLGSRGLAGRDVFPRGSPAPEAQGPAPLAELSVFKLLDALQKVLERARADVSFEVSAERITITERMAQITDLIRRRKRCAFDDLFEDLKSTYDIVVTFLAVLEMAKMRVLRVYQAGSRMPIHLEYRVASDEGDEEGPVPSKDTDPGTPDWTSDAATAPSANEWEVDTVTDAVPEYDEPGDDRDTPPVRDPDPTMPHDITSLDSGADSVQDSASDHGDERQDEPER